MKFRPGDRIKTSGWNPSTDLREFTVVEVFEDGWLKALDEKQRFRMFDALVCRKVEPNPLRGVE